MPNWATNTIAFTGKPETINTLKSSIDESTGSFDFNVFFPCPEELRNSTSPIHVFKTQEEVDEYSKKHAEEPFYRGKIVAVTEEEMTRRVRDYGATDWYDWCTNNWGTKWEGGEAEILDSGNDYLVVRFDTAWCAPAGIFKWCQDHGVHICGGTIHEDGNEFELHGSQEEFDDHFELEEETQKADGYEWVNRWIVLNPEAKWAPYIDPDDIF